MIERLKDKIRIRRKALELFDEQKNYAGCLKVEGQILELENLLSEIFSQQAVEADAGHCGNCGGELQTYCKNCFNSGAKNRQRYFSTDLFN